MADAMSDYLENEIMDHIFGTGAWTAPATIHVALFGTTGSLILLEQSILTGEIAVGSYARSTTGTWGIAGAPPTSIDGHVDNTADITFPLATADWGDIRFAALMDGAVGIGDNVLFYGQLTADKTVSNGDTFKFNIGDFDITIS